ncbi:TonB-dependent receptor plug domain-containing protein [Brevundimonas sp.]|uniref:TonB-dependent receptor plug domain-containing protein n=1 Tax=Brevundimonas sp. TaxID=1871086 RepID=UPI002D682279|nr:TonB-dependent receptor [Brevundimonas sp.]HYC69476.1 TonB-dependent receptor [Brevundimonas sp.]
MMGHGGRTFAWKAGRRAALTLALVAAPLTAQAQTAPAAASADDRVYEAAEFARFAPQNALDMLNQVPGFTIRQATVERGFGQATGNVLLNGQRISNKSDDILAQLRRIPAGNVVRIEIRDGSTLGIPGLSGQVANVVSRSTRLRGQWAYRPEFRARFTDPLATRFETSVSGEHGPVQFTFGLENQASHSGAGGDTLIYNGAGALIEERLDVWTGETEQPRVSARFVIDGPGDAVGNLNMAYRDLRFTYDEDGFRRAPGLPDRDRDAHELQDGWDYEIGGDYEFGWGPGKLKLIGLDRLSAYDYDSAVTVDWADGRPRQGDRFNQVSEEGERILRGEYSWKQGAADWQISAEAAFNSLESETRLFTLLPSGSEQEVPFANGSARVEETRYEVIGSYGRPVSETLSFQASAGAEFSELTQVGAGGLSRSFWRPKGQLSAVWSPEPETKVNLRLQRRVGQLNFSDFLASVNLNSGTQFSGNPNLVPPQSWEFEAELVKTHGAWGNSTLRLYGASIEDIVDIVPIGATGESIGNLDEAVRYGVEFRATTNLDPLGVRGMKLDSRFILQRSQVEDPLTGEDREISGSLKRLASLTLRHDVPETDWAWGAALSHQRSAQTYRLTELSRQFEMPIYGSVFIENKDVFGLTVRATAGNIFEGESYLFREVHAGRRTEPVAFFERRDRTIGPIFSFEIRGEF